MRDRVATIGPFAAVAGMLGLCCGLPVLLSIGVLGAIAGWSLQSWVLLGLGLVAAAAGWTRWARSRRRDQTRQDRPLAAHEDAASDQTADSTTKGTNL